MICWILLNFQREKCIARSMVYPIHLVLFVHFLVMSEKTSTQTHSVDSLTGIFAEKRKLKWNKSIFQASNVDWDQSTWSISYPIVFNVKHVSVFTFCQHLTLRTGFQLKRIISKFHVINGTAPFSILQISKYTYRSFPASWDFQIECGTEVQVVFYQADMNSWPQGYSESHGMVELYLKLSCKWP